MKISIKAHPKSKKIAVLKKGEGQYEVWVREAPDNGKANQAVIEALSEHLGVARYRLSIVSGLASRHKVIEVN